MASNAAQATTTEGLADQERQFTKEVNEEIERTFRLIWESCDA